MLGTRIRMSLKNATEVLEFLCNILGCRTHWQLYLLSRFSVFCVRSTLGSRKPKCYLYVCLFVCVYIYIYIYMCVCVYVCVCKNAVDLFTSRTLTRER